MNSIVERTWQSLVYLRNSLLVHARVDDSCTHFALKYACRIFSAIPIRNLRHQGLLTTSDELFYGKKPNINNYRVLFCPCVVKKYTYYKKNEKGALILSDVKPLSQRGFRGMFVGFNESDSGYQVYIPNTRQIVSSRDVIFDEDFVSTLAHKHQSYKEALKVRHMDNPPSSNFVAPERTGDITTMHPFSLNTNSSSTTSLDKGVEIENDAKSE